MTDENKQGIKCKNIEACENKNGFKHVQMYDMKCRLLRGLH
jgi:hypothetical protein